MENEHHPPPPALDLLGLRNRSLAQPQSVHVSNMSNTAFMSADFFHPSRLDGGRSPVRMPCSNGTRLSDCSKRSFDEISFSFADVQARLFHLASAFIMDAMPSLQRAGDQFQEDTDYLSLPNFVDKCFDQDPKAKPGISGSSILANMGAPNHSVTPPCQGWPNDDAQTNDHAQPLFQKSAFGSDLLFPSLRNRTKHIPLQPGGRSAHRLLYNAPSRTHVDNTSSRFNAIGKQSTSQMTIFYSGMVSVFDDMPAELAQAIMTLAAAGVENCEFSTMSDEASVDSNSRDISSVPPRSTSAVMNAADNIPMETPEPHTLVSDSLSRSRSISLPVPANLSSGVHPMSSVGIEKRQMPRGQLHADIPFARKASLARFLEKRRNMLQVTKTSSTNQTTKPNNNTEEGNNCPPLEMATARKKRCISPPEPSPAECPFLN
eukprot:c20516_g1_i1 orf=249-1544(-)